MSVAVMMCLNANAQWTNKNVNNDFDEPYRICYTESNDNNYLKLENLNGEIYFFMKGGYYCDEAPTIDLAFIVKGVSKKYSVYGTISSSSEAVFIVDNLLSNADMLLDFKTCTTLKVRLNDSVCGTETYSFSMAGSQSAINFISTK
jgi:hypothetical protein